MADITKLLYAATTAFSFYGFALFLWWAIRSKTKPSIVYYYIMLLFLGIGLDRAVTYYIRTIFLSGVPVDPYLNSWFWCARLWLELASIVAIVVHMSYRAFWLNRKDNAIS